MTQSRAVERFADRLLAQSRRDFGTIARAVDPRLSDRRVADLHEAFTAIIVADLPGFDRSADAVRRRLHDAVRGWLAAETSDPATARATGSMGWQGTGQTLTVDPASSGFSLGVAAV
jgi:hypothetical protein